MDVSGKIFRDTESVVTLYAGSVRILVVYTIVSDSVVVILRLIARGIAVGVVTVYHKDWEGNPPPKEKGK